MKFFADLEAGDRNVESCHWPKLNHVSGVRHVNAANRLSLTSLANQHYDLFKLQPFSPTLKTLSSNADMARTSLNDRVQALPAELFKYIRDFVFTAPSGRIIDVTCSNCTRSMENQLQVDRATREAFARTYYGNNTFLMPRPRDLGSWLHLLPEPHRQSLTAVRVIAGEITEFEAEGTYTKWWWDLKSLLVEQGCRSVLKDVDLELHHGDSKAVTHQGDVHLGGTKYVSFGGRVRTGDTNVASRSEFRTWEIDYVAKEKWEEVNHRDESITAFGHGWSCGTTSV